MNTNGSGLRIRDAVPSDATPLCDILNTIIRAGGTTAMETPLTSAEFSGSFLEGERFLVCFVAEDIRTGTLSGFQALSRHSDLPEDWADIATFARQEPSTPGVGTALFAQTRRWAKGRDLAAINAAIRADNRSGLAYYEKMGFRTYNIVTGVPLQDGTPVDRILKRYLVREKA